MLNLNKNMYSDLEFLGSAERYVESLRGVIEHIKLFEDFSFEEIKTLSFYLHCYRAPANYTLLEEGAEGDYLVLILRGSARVDKLVFKQGITKIADVKIGAVLGEMSLIDGRPRFASCVTTEATDFAVLTHDALNEVLVHHSRLGNKFLLVLLQLMAQRLRETSDKFLSGGLSVVV
ncbi:MAG: cyclic nucleotide-binding domain-containing protein [Methylophilaceae bacterium]